MDGTPTFSVLVCRAEIVPALEVIVMLAEEEQGAALLLGFKSNSGVLECGSEIIQLVFATYIKTLVLRALVRLNPPANSPLLLRSGERKKRR